MKRMSAAPLIGLIVFAMSTVAHAREGANGSSLNALAMNGLGADSPRRTLDEYLRNLPMDAPFVKAPQSHPTTPVRKEMTDTALLDSEQGRETLKYLVSCALPDSVELVAVRDGVEYRFRGAMNLAPRWLDTKLTESEERWVSACMLARTNYFRKKIMISLQSRAEVVPEFLEASPEEKAATPLYEGDFFGNIFTDTPSAYACVGRRTQEQSRDDILKARICTEADPSVTGTPFPLSYCTFYLTGDCDAPGSHSPNGEEFKEYVSVYLRPLGPRAAQSAVEQRP